MEDWMLIGLMAGLFTTVGFVPQIVKGYSTKCMDGISLFMPVLLGIGMFLWLCYGIMLNDIPIMFWNSVALLLNASIIVLIVRYRNNHRENDG